MKMSEADRLSEGARRAFAAGDLPTAETMSRQLAAVSPRDARPWSLLAETALKRNRPDAAIACAERAATLGPYDPFALLMRAKCRALIGDRRSALEAAEAVTAVKLLPPEVQDGLGAVFSMLGRHERALELFRRAVAADPRNPQFVYNLAAAERMTGAFAQAESHCDRAVGLDPHFYMAHHLRADLRTWSPERNHVAALESLLAKGPRNWQGEVLLRYALGKECEDLGDYPRAFAHLAAGAALHRKQYRYDVAAEIAAIDEVILAQPPAGPGYEDAAPVFVVGLARSGTTLVERIAASHPAFVSAGETGLFGRLSRSNGGVALGTAYVEALGTLGLQPGRRTIDKTLQNYLACGRILAALPKAKIVMLTRRPMDQGWALLKALFAGTFAFSYDQAELGEYLLAFRRLLRHWRATLPESSYLELAYEDIVADQEGVSRRLIRFLGEDWDDEVLRFHAGTAPSATASAVQVRRPVYASSVGKWRHYAEQLGPLRDVLAREVPEAELV